MFNLSIVCNLIGQACYEEPIVVMSGSDSSNGGSSQVDLLSTITDTTSSVLSDESLPEDDVPPNSTDGFAAILAAAMQRLEVDPRTHI